MLPLIGRAPDGQAVLYPDAHAADVEAGLLKGPSEVDAFHVRMEDVGTAALRHERSHVFEGCQQEVEELLVAHAVVLDGLAVGGFVGHIVGRVGHHEVGANIAHEPGHVLLAGAVPAHHRVLAQRPDVPALHERRNGLGI